MNQLSEIVENVSRVLRKVWASPVTRKGASLLLPLILGGVITLVTVIVLFLNARPDLSVWHTVKLENQFEAGSDVGSFQEYLELEERLFEELDEKVYAIGVSENPEGIARYLPGSPANPSSFQTDWNRTFEWAVPNGKPRGGVLLLHGMSDSPYSLRHIGKTLHERDMHVIGLRLPGHGTAPSGLKYFDWKDMEAAVNLAVRHLKEEVGEMPIYLVGYSNGGALAVQYGVESLKDSDLPKVEGIILYSPAVGVTPAAALAIWQRRLGNVLGLDKLAWNAVASEYDPFKYVSFAVNAGVQVHDLTVEIKKDLSAMKKKGRLGDFPRVLAFQSIVDATVSPPALIDVLFGELPQGEHELVLFDLNRTGLIESLVKSDPLPEIRDLIRSTSKTYSISFVSNEGTGKDSMQVHYYHPDRAEPEVKPLEGAWPQGIYSLSHIAVPFPANDMLYGSEPVETGAYHIGSAGLRGERGVLTISASDQLRLRFNPFYSFLEEKLLTVVAPGSL